MPTIETIIRQINREIVPQFEEKLRAYLAGQDKEWLVEQIVRLTLDAHSLQELDRKHNKEEENRKRAEFSERVKGLALDEGKLQVFISAYRKITREALVARGLLLESAPQKGEEMIPEGFRTVEGNSLLRHAKDMLFGMLFGDADFNATFNRTHRELLSLTIPRMKTEALNFMKATTEFDALGTWQDPKGTASDSRADYILMEIEYGEVDGELIGEGIVSALKLINHLEINEKILYARMSEVEQSTLASQRMMKIQ
ncbi:MAG: hypothetical protein IPG44_06640 [Anaerolineales bacterium]|jgi:hypothetical protein|nr:hypothetical protein [Anaerolineales bacterium]MCC6987091.1 hypothetical protein [Anaerolineales bacterium]